MPYANREDKRENDHKYKQEHREQSRQYSRKFAEKHREQIRQYSRKYAKKRERTEYLREYRKTHVCEHGFAKCSMCTPIMVLRQYANGAKARGYSWNITEEHGLCLLAGNCAYCDLRPVRMGIDRVDNTRGYEPDNVVSCCWECNLTKKARTRTDFVAHCIRVARFNLPEWAVLNTPCNAPSCTPKETCDAPSKF